MRIEKGKFYRSRDGGRVGPMTPHMSDSWRIDMTDRGELWREDGLRYYPESRGDTDLVAEWVDDPVSPVRTVTRKEIVPGTYGRIEVNEVYQDQVVISFTDRLRNPLDRGNFSASELRAMSVTLTQLADALEGVTSDRG